MIIRGVETTPSVATFDGQTTSARDVLALKGDARVSVVIPARDEQLTVSSVVDAVYNALVRAYPIVDELVVVDDGSSDDTAVLAEKAGATVVKPMPRDDAPAYGKGNAMREGLEQTTGDLVVFLDADVTNFAPHFVTGLLAPLLAQPEIQLVKGFYERPIADDPGGGGRVTELVARPVLSLLFPELSVIRQPLAGETAVRRSALDSVVFEPGYGVEIGLLLDCFATFGTAGLAQVDLGRRLHRNRPLAQLAPQAREVLAAALSRADITLQ
jgi:glucosyl-3-phosphoglycerate synthase